MRVTTSAIPDVLLIEPKVFSDDRGEFFESYSQERFDHATGGTRRFVQDNHSVSARHVLRGLHYQIAQPQAKLVRAVAGEIFDVCVDLRRRSKTFGRWVGTTLSGANRRQVWIPEGFAHGFLVLSEQAEVIYKTTDYYAPEAERTVRWDDPALGIAWPTTAPVILSPKDADGRWLADADLFP
ncbi:MAG: dTDP-4-dehydrorhamnose 3,5-epimerase [Acidobacteriota bacterium]|nr:dTDP-4-dehydrorhamnose 3,5-epimerase [Acidobacteriota bacterium]